MEISNQKRARNIKRFFILSGILIVIVSQFLLWYKKNEAVIITAILFGLYVVFILFANYNSIFFSSEGGKITIRYYPVITIFRKEYNTIEFPHETLLNFQIEKGLGYSDLTIAIRTKRGIAEYPSISLAALSKAEIEQIRATLLEIMQKNRAGS